MLNYPDISPEIFSIGPIALRWYGLMYVIGFVLGFYILKARVRRKFLQVSMEAADSYITYLIVGMLIGARLAYVFIYKWDYYSIYPSEIFAVWQGGLSFHGAMLGMIGASWVYAWKHQVPLHQVLDTLAIGAPLGLFFGRIGNFINAELYGRVSDFPLAMVFPTDPTQMPRHPSQIYQGLTEGLALFAVLCVLQKYWLKRGKLRNGMLGASFVAGYGFFRFWVEFTREPDPQLGFVLGPLSMGQILCLLMIVASIFQFWYVFKTQELLKPKPIKGGKKQKGSFLERQLARWVA